MLVVFALARIRSELLKARTFVCVALLLSIAPAVVSAVVPQPPPLITPAPADGTVTGFVWSAVGEPIADAPVRLRNVLTGFVVARTVTDRKGAFVFEHIPGSATYVAELVNDRGALRAVGHTFTLAPGDIVATFIRLGGPAPWLFGVFGNAAASVVSAAAAIGIPASVPPEQPISPIR